jgi:hypothetical protein
MSGEQKLIHYVARKALIEDYIFSIAYYLTLQPDGSIPFMFLPQIGLDITPFTG